MRDAREAKLHTRAGMGACQGRVCGAALQALKGWAPGVVRPPLFPLRFPRSRHSATHDGDVSSPATRRATFHQ